MTDAGGVENRESGSKTEKFNIIEDKWKEAIGGEVNKKAFSVTSDPGFLHLRSVLQCTVPASVRSYPSHPVLWTVSTEVRCILFQATPRSGPVDDLPRPWDYVEIINGLS